MLYFCGLFQKLFYIVCLPIANKNANRYRDKTSQSVHNNKFPVRHAGDAAQGKNDRAHPGNKAAHKKRWDSVLEKIAFHHGSSLRVENFSSVPGQKII